MVREISRCLELNLTAKEPPFFCHLISFSAGVPAALRHTDAERRRLQQADAFRLLGKNAVVVAAGVGYVGWLVNGHLTECVPGIV